MKESLLILGAGQYGSMAVEVAISMNRFDKIAFLDDIDGFSNFTLKRNRLSKAESRLFTRFVVAIKIPCKFSNSSNTIF